MHVVQRRKRGDRAEGSDTEGNEQSSQDGPTGRMVVLPWSCGLLDPGFLCTLSKSLSPLLPRGLVPSVGGGLSSS